MNMLLSTISKEKIRIECMLTKYREIYDSLPKGTISEKQVGSKTYYYLKYRDGKKVRSKYINLSDIYVLREQIEKRRHIETMMKSLEKELAIANKVLEEQL